MEMVEYVSFFRSLKRGSWHVHTSDAEILIVRTLSREYTSAMGESINYNVPRNFRAHYAFICWRS